MRKVVALIVGIFVVLVFLVAVRSLPGHLGCRHDRRDVTLPQKAALPLAKYFTVPGYEGRLVRDGPVPRQGANASTSVQYNLGQDVRPDKFVEALEARYAVLGWRTLEYELFNPSYPRGALPEWDLWPAPQSRPAEPIWLSSWVRGGEILSVAIVRIVGHETGGTVCVVCDIAHFQGAYALQLLANYRAHHPPEVLSQHSTDGQQNADERNANDDP
jgi:hypothetical protein